MNTAMFLLCTLFGLATIADCVVTFYAVSKGLAEELNKIVKWLLKCPLCFIVYECGLIVVVVLVCYGLLLWQWWWRVTSFTLVILAVLWKALLVYRNLKIVGGKP